jgi:hypothetical protein
VLVGRVERGGVHPHQHVAGAEFSGGTVGFSGAEFPGGTVDFSRVANWTQPPDFGSGFDMPHPPAGVTALGLDRHHADVAQIGGDARCPAGCSVPHRDQLANTRPAAYA